MTKSFEDRMKELKDGYENMPEFVSAEDIQRTAERKGRKAKNRKRMTVIGAALAAAGISSLLIVSEPGLFTNENNQGASSDGNPAPVETNDEDQEQNESEEDRQPEEDENSAPEETNDEDQESDAVNVTEEGTVRLDESDIQVTFNGDDVWDAEEDLLEPLQEQWEEIGGLELMNPHSEDEPVAAPEPGPTIVLGDATMSPDEQKAAFTISHTADIGPYSVTGIVDLNTQEVSFMNVTPQNISQLVWSQDNRYLAYETASLAPHTTGLYVDDTEAGETVFSLDSDQLDQAVTLQTENLQWQEDSSHLEISGDYQEESFVWVLDMETGEWEESMSEHLPTQLLQQD